MNKIKTVSRIELCSIIEQSEVIDDQALIKHLPTIVDTFVDVMRDFLIEHKSIRLKNIGTLAVRYKKERSNARNVRSGEAVIIPARHVITLNKNFKTENKCGLPEIVDEFQSRFFIKDKNIIREMFLVILDEIKKVQTGQQRIEIRTLGVFYPSFIEQRNSRNPKTGETLIADATIKIAYKVSRNLLEEINESVTV
jgi:nucleoid DNA-binding protein